MYKQKSVSRILIFAIGISLFLLMTLIILAGSLIFLVRQSYKEQAERNRIFNEIGQEIHARVKVGDDREKAIRAMVDAGAWSYIKCGELEKDVIFDYYYFGPKDRNKVFAWMTSSIYKNGSYIVQFIGNNSDSIDVPEDCLPPELE